MSEFNVDIAIKHRDQYYLYMRTGASGLCYAIEQFYGLERLFMKDYELKLEESLKVNKEMSRQWPRN